MKRDVDLTSKPSSTTEPPRSAEMSTYARSRDMRSPIDSPAAQCRGCAEGTVLGASHELNTTRVMDPSSREQRGQAQVTPRHPICEEIDQLAQKLDRHRSVS